MLEDIQMLLNEPFHVQFFLLLGLSFFLGIVLTAAVAVVFSFKIDRHLKKHYFAQWKLSRGTYQERRRVIVPKDSYYNKIVKQQRSIHRGIAFLWLIVLLVVTIILYINKNS